MLEVGEVYEKYRVEGVLGKGAMATVYKVRHTLLQSEHAMKVLELHSEDIKRRLLLEGQLQSRLQHPNIVSVTDVVWIDGSLALVMEYIAGPTLEHWLQQGLPEIAEAEELFRQILNGVEEAHAQQMVHRDLKAGNILLKSVGGRLLPKIADFGLAKVLGELPPGSKATAMGVMMGTPAYMAPEQSWNAGYVDHRADIFALGCIFYEMFVGRTPFDDPDYRKVIDRVRVGVYTPLNELRSDVPERLVAAIHACLRVDPEDRPHTAAALRALLDPQPQSQGRGILPQVPTVPRTPALPAPPPIQSVEGEASPSLPAAPVVSIQRSLVVGLLMGGVILSLLSAGIWWKISTLGAMVEAPPLENPVLQAQPAPPPQSPPPVEVAPVEAPPAEIVPVAPPPNRPKPPISPPVAPPAPVVPPVADAPVAAATGQVLISSDGEAPAFYLKDAKGTHSPGTLTAGSYEVWYQYPGEQATQLGSIVLQADQVLRYRCQAGFKLCQKK